MGKLDEFIASLPKMVVNTEYGFVKGYVSGGVANFKGVPYAAAPAGRLRWRPPEPPSPWREPLDATKFGFVCPQDGSRFPVFGKMGEDCLNLNIWAPEKTGGRPYPVMVFLHGGGFTTGSGTLPPYDGTYFASQGVVLVTINYRLNALGFLALPELTSESSNRSSGNYGIMDQVFALEWIKRNIGQFGGDPACITVFGESAGGASVVALLSSPVATGLFHRAIVQSGGNLPSHLRELGASNGRLESAESIGREFVRKLGFDGGKGTLEKIRNLSAEQLALAWFKYVQESIAGVGVTGGWLFNQLIVDGYILPDSPAEVFRKGRQHNVPFITGANADEGTLFQFLLLGTKPDLDRYTRYVERAFGKSKDDVLQRFNATGHSVGEAACNILGAGFFCGTRRLARGMSAIQPKTYRYLFSMPPKFFIYQIPGIADWKERFGCYHAAEIPYVFHFMLLPGLEDEDRALSGQMAGYWMRFARTGDPNGDGTPRWPRYSPEDEQYLILDNPVEVGRGFEAELCDFVDELEEASV
jgi:para-nitrobenzyl esterase